jgi:hypothetical protein
VQRARFERVVLPGTRWDKEADALEVLQKPPMTRLAALVIAFALALSGCNDSDDDGDSGYTGTTVSPDDSGY